MTDSEHTGQPPLPEIEAALSATPTVYVVDNDPEMRQSLYLLLQSAQLNVEAYPSALDFLEAFRDGTPCCLVLDVRMPGMSGLELLDELARRQVTIPTIMITGYGHVRMAVRAIQAGAVDFLEKPFSRQVLLQRVQASIRQDIQARAERLRRDEVQARLARLTPREREVLDLLVDGHSTKLIAQELGISPKTVDNHRSKILEKMHTHATAHLVWLVLRYGGPHPL